jgi:2-polyprenyl-3-methyl-5-hydroxy-6-metoxy-1,4-benzoquinol methylase
MQQHLKAWKDEYTRASWKGPYNIDAMKKYLSQGAKVLDIGCGSGKLFSPLQRAGYNVTGIDLSRMALMSIRSGGSLLQADIINLPFKDNTFDGAICYDVLQHLLIEERVKAVEEIKRALMPGGLLFFEGFGKSDMRYGGTLVEENTFRRDTGIIYHYFSEEELRSLLAGFNIINVESTTTIKTFKGENFTRHRISAVAQK